MNFISNMLGGGGSAAQSDASASGAVANQLSLLGASSDVLLSDGTSKVGGTQTTVGQAV